MLGNHDGLRIPAIGNVDFPIIKYYSEGTSAYVLNFAVVGSHEGLVDILVEVGVQFSVGVGEGIGDQAIDILVIDLKFFILLYETVYKFNNLVGTIIRQLISAVAIEHTDGLGFY